VHLTSESSLAELNRRIVKNSGTDQTVSDDHFRANIVVSESVAWDEDHWARLRFSTVSEGSTESDAELYQLQNCERCVQTQVTRDATKILREPIKTLKT